MGTDLIRIGLVAALLTAGAARAASAQTCITIDEQRDMLGPEERTAARLLIGKQFELAGHRVVDRDCATTYTVSHIRLGATITVTLAGPNGKREATALGLDDLPAVYSQMVRAITTGQPMGMGVLDRTNVSATQDTPPRRVFTEGFWYARLGYGSLLADSAHGGASFGFGYRAVFNRLGLDLSVFNGQVSDEGGFYSSSGSSAWSLIKLQGLYFVSPKANRSAYFGGGLSYGRTEVRSPATTDFFAGSGYGSGLQADLTAGYEIARVTSARVFVQTDVTLPFYNVHLETYSYPQPPVNGRYVAPTMTVERQYAPSVAVSIGFGWQRRVR
jgi:hypothetical protein